MMSAKTKQLLNLFQVIVWNTDLYEEIEIHILLPNIIQIKFNLMLCVQIS